MSRFKPDRAHYIRPDMIEQRDQESSAVAYLYTGKHGQPVALYFSGKRQRPDDHIRYPTAERRAERVQQFFDQVRSRERYQVERRAQIKNARNADKALNVPADGYMSAPAVAAFLRQCLKEAFPGVRFSVTTDRSLRVRWTDGPSRAAVEKIAGTFAGSYFDGMIDFEGAIYHSIDGQKVRFGASYVFCERTMSVEALTVGAEALRARYPATNQAPAVITPAEFADWSPRVEANPDFPGALEGRHAGDVELVAPDDEHGLSRFVRPAVALEYWFDHARPFAVQPSPTFDRVAILGTDGYGNTALPAADGGETGRCYPRQREDAEAGRVREAIEQAGREAAEALAKIAAEPRAVDCEIIDFAPHLAAHIARADAARRVN